MEQRMPKFQLVFGEYNENVIEMFALLTKQYSSSYRYRLTKVFTQFSLFIQEFYEEITTTNFVHAFVHFRELSLREQNKSVLSINDDMRALRNILQSLINMHSLPMVHLPPNLNIDTETFKSNEHNPVLGSLNPKKWRDDLADKPLPLLMNVQDSEYLGVFMEHIRDHRNLLLKIARDYVSKSYQRYLSGQRYIDTVDPAIFETPDNLSQTWLSTKGQRLSLFSEHLSGDQGLGNLVAFLKWKFNGLLSRKFSGGNNHLYRFHGRTYLSEHLGISSDLAAACAIIITIEAGVNPESLYRMKIKHTGNNIVFYIPAEDGCKSFYLSYAKPRGKRVIHQKRVIPVIGSINTKFCLNFVLEATQHHRTLIDESKANYLFIHDSTIRDGEVCPISSTAFKAAFHRILLKALCEEMKNDESLLTEGLTSLTESQPNLAKLRRTEGVLRWFDSGGDPRAAARYLGNTTQVAIRNYLPKELQIMLYTKHIRAFQHILITVATDNTTYQHVALGLHSVDELNEYLEQLSREDLSWSILKKSQSDIKLDPQVTYTVVLSESNIALLYAAYKSYKQQRSQGIDSSTKLEFWASIATSLLTNIKTHGTRAQKLIMKKGIDLYNETPSGFKL